MNDHAVKPAITHTATVTPDAIMQLGLGFFASKTMLSAVELGLFTTLAEGPLGADAIRSRLGLHRRSMHDFLDALVALGMLAKVNGLYSNTAATDRFLDRGKQSYMGGILEMANARLYGFWGSLTEGLRTGEPQNEAKTGGDLFDAIYRDDAKLAEFVRAMTGLSLGAGMALAQKFPWSEYSSFVDVGTAEGGVPVAIAKAHPHLRGSGLDLPAVGPHFEAFMKKNGVGDRVKFVGGDFFVDPLPKADVVVMGHILHDWGIDKKRELIAKAYDALPSGGALLIFDPVIDDERRENIFGLLVSLNMLIETREGADFTFSDCKTWMREAGFRDMRSEPLVGPDSMVIGIK